MNMEATDIRNAIALVHKIAELNRDCIALRSINDDLLAALKAISAGNTMQGRETWTHADVLQEHYRIARNAIAKAERKE
jgi:hypothetical protein